jgi:mono/diheme cytochrome c family protein
MAGLHEEPLPPGLPPVTYAPREPRLRRPPFLFIAIGVTAMVASWVPLVLFARARVERSEQPRISIMQDMGTQPKFREQQTSDIFADGRADRPHVTGTIARGGLQEDDHYFRGYTMAAGSDGKSQAKFFEGFPKQVQVTKPLLERGKDRFNIYCSACHGLDGYARGTVEIRSEELGTPLNAKSLHEDLVRGRSEGHIFNTITNGIRNMPSYSAQIPVEDRWAIVAYVRALQLSQNAPPSVVASVSTDAPAPSSDTTQASRQ